MCKYFNISKSGYYVSIKKAESVNGILKNEFLLDSTFENYYQCYKTVKEAIETYNNERPHWSLELKTPTQVHNHEYKKAV